MSYYAIKMIPKVDSLVMQILTKSKCKKCNGYKKIIPPEWKDKTGKILSTSESLEFYSKYNISTLHVVPVTCYKCDGKGEIEEWKDLKEILRLAKL